MTSAEFQIAISRAADQIKSHQPETRKYTLSIKKRFHGKPLLEVYTQSFPHVDEAYWVEKINKGNLTLNNSKTSTDEIVVAGQITEHIVPATPEPMVNFEVQLISDQQDFWVLSKPSPLPMHSGGRYLNNNFTHLLKTAFPKLSIHVVNRLDANTTGIVLVALNKKTAFELGKQFQERSVSKKYLALVEGDVLENTFSSSKSISKEKTPAGGRKIEDGYESFTEFTVLNRKKDTTLLQVQPHSGRTNQIRLHLADMNHAIIGDLGYKNPEYFKSNPLTYATDSLFLHAWKLELHHPINNIKMEFEAQPNEKWNQFLDSSFQNDIS